jgi:hypothetical protein
MRTFITTWTKTELKIYILCLCAKADLLETADELEIIQSKTNKETFDKIYSEFSGDNEETSFEKIENTIERLDYTNMELIDLKKEIYEVFYSDNKFPMKERNLDQILNNMLY